MSVIISPDIAFPGEESPPFPFNHGRIGYQTILPVSTVVASTEAAGFPIEAVYNPLTAEQWKPTASPAVIDIDRGEIARVDYIGFAAHNFATTSASILIEYSFDNVTFETFGDFSPANNKPVMILSATIVKAQYWRITVTYSGDAPQIGAIYAGEALAMQRPIYGGFTPTTMARRAEYVNNRSNTNQFLGRSILRKGVELTIPFQNLTAQWFRDNFEPFILDARDNPFFFAWNPEQYPDEVGFLWTTADPIPSNQGTRDLMSVSMAVVGLQDD